MSNPPLTAYVDFPSASGTTTGPLTDIYGVVRINNDNASAISASIVASNGLQLSGSVTGGELKVTNSGGSGIQVSGSSGGIVVTGGATLDQLFGGVNNTVTSITSNASTILTANRIVRASASGTAYTGTILAAGATDGQTVRVTNENTTAANAISFAAVATSNVLNGSACIISGGVAKDFTWLASLSTSGLWVSN